MKNQTLRPFENPRRSGHPEVLTLVRGRATRQSHRVRFNGIIVRFRQHWRYVCVFMLGFERAVFSRYFYFVIFIFGNFRLTAATTEACSGFPELLARASRA
jgi:hypothetical protein